MADLKWHISFRSPLAHLRWIHVIERLDVPTHVVAEGVLLVRILDDVCPGHVKTHVADALEAELLPPPVDILPVGDLHLNDLLDLVQLIRRQKLLHHQTLLIRTVPLTKIFYVNNTTTLYCRYCHQYINMKFITLLQKFDGCVKLV